MDIPSGPVVKTQHFHCRASQVRNQDPTCHMTWPKKRPGTSEKVRKSEECRHLGKEHFRQAEDHCGLNCYPTETLKSNFLVPIKFALIWK